MKHAWAGAAIVKKFERSKRKTLAATEVHIRPPFK